MTNRSRQTTRRSLRLKGYDYSQVGAYFITICTYRRACWFGNIDNDEMRLNRFGAVVRDEWLRTAAIRGGVEIDSFVVMPDHFHGIIVISRATHRVAPTTLRPNSVGSIIGQFKPTVTKRLRRLGLIDFRWQRNYYEHVIRNDADLNEIREYISGNPLKWQLDKENPKFIPAPRPASESKQSSPSELDLLRR